MKYILFAALLTGATAAYATATVATQTTTMQTAPGQTPMSKQEMKKQRKLRKQTGPEVYKGTVAEQRRIVTDAPGAEKEDRDGDTSTKKEKKIKKK
ncbi:hypothetical protein [Hymenobacter sp. BRD67]|uniref:hypothetical protein n=1 Tax=Hymenobacter sp. BRD67 TaxID=2675877 RepID=UPI0015651F9E|nr:hypothetical protein [Hymenobacter sp. BRD67]QKG51500.1 hypothetical protein GKZ67_01485 [Hymenobacter sp. BRD67]